MRELINPGTTPQVYTQDGRSIAAGTRLSVDSLDVVGEAAVSGGRLALEESGKDGKTANAKPETSTVDADADSTTTTARRTQGTRK